MPIDRNVKLQVKTLGAETFVEGPWNFTKSDIADQNYAYKYLNDSGEPITSKTIFNLEYGKKAQFKVTLIEESNGNLAISDGFSFISVVGTFNHVVQDSALKALTDNQSPFCLNGAGAIEVTPQKITEMAILDTNQTLNDCGLYEIKLFVQDISSKAVFSCDPQVRNDEPPP